jgi:glutathione synthase/RimK-type ligase-like ATP-grasp enzyme
MRKLAILSTDDLEEFFVYDHLAYAPLAKRGWSAQEVSWHDKSVDWNDFEAVIIRSTWDYQSEPEAFLRVLEQIDASSAALENSLSLVKWNISKDYLRELESKAVPIVPTIWCETYDYSQILNAFDILESEEIVLKPWISANADHTYRLRLNDVQQQPDGLESVFADRKYMIQPFLSSVINEGEYSLFYFNGEYSHCIVKIPKAKDFRVQEEHGGQLHSVSVDDELLGACDFVLAALPEIPLYARIDLLKHQSKYVVMEIELIEPSLYFNMDSDSAERFAQAFVGKYGEGEVSK